MLQKFAFYHSDISVNILLGFVPKDIQLASHLGLLFRKRRWQ